MTIAWWLPIALGFAGVIVWGIGETLDDDLRSGVNPRDMIGPALVAAFVKAAGGVLLLGAIAASGALFMGLPSA